MTEVSAQLVIIVVFNVENQDTLKKCVASEPLKQLKWKVQSIPISHMIILVPKRRAIIYFKTVTNKQLGINRSMTDINANNIKIKFRIDTGADVTVNVSTISSETFRLFEDAKLLPS